jgi:hypothetical protein
MTSKDKEIGEFLVARGGPFYELQLRLGMLHEDALRAGTRAVIFVGLAWGVPLFLSLIEGNALGPAAERPFLLDPGVWARFFIAVGIFILVERQIEIQLRAALDQFTDAPLLAPSSFAPAAQAVATALRRRDSRLAEVICLVIAVALSLASLLNVHSAGVSFWGAEAPSGQVSLTLAGWWCLLVSSPIFWFLFLRGFWRHLVWSLLLRRLATLDLRLVATHPDGKGGLGFIGRYPNAYAMFIFGISCVLGAALARQLLQQDLSVTAYGYVMAGWLVIVFAFFAFPLVAFAKPLAELKEKTLLLYSSQATQFQRLAERKLIGANILAPDAAEAEEQKDVGDPAKQYDAARKLSIFLVNRSALVPLAAAALLPLVAAGATELPYKEIVSIAKKLLLL